MGPGWWQASDSKFYPPQAPMAAPPQKRTNPWTIVGWAVVILIFLPCFGCGAIAGITALGSTATTTTTEVNEPSGTRDSETGSGSTATSHSAPAPIGTTVTAAKGWDVTVISANLDATQAALSYNQFNTPTEGSGYVSVTVELANTGTESQSVGSNVDLSLLTTDGAAIREAMVAGVPDDLSAVTHLQPGGSVTATIFYEVPREAVAGLVLLAEPTFTMDRVKDQRFLALR